MTIVGAPPRTVLPAVILLWLAGLSLRITVLALPAVLNQVSAALALDGGDIGVLTAIPSLCFALAAIPGALLVRRLGALGCLIAGLVLNAGGAMLRGVAPDMATLALATGGMSLGIALMQVTLPSLVRRWMPRQVGLATAVYTFGLLIGEVAPVAGPFPWVIVDLGAPWRSQLALWALPVIVTTVAVLLLRPRNGGGNNLHPPRWPDWSQGALWQTGLLIGAVNAAYFGLNGFLPLWLAQAGQRDAVSDILFVLNLAQLPAALLMMIAAERLVRERWVYVAASLALLASALFLALAPGFAPLAMAATAGFCLALLLALALTVPPLVSSEDGLPSLTAGAFTLGYGIAVVMSLATGWLDGVTRAVSILPIALASASIAVIGWAINRTLDHPVTAAEGGAASCLPQR